MVKKENANFSLPETWVGPRSEPDVPPGFPPKASTTSAAVEAPKTQNPTSIENGFGLVHGQMSNSSGEQPPPPRRTSRKRSRPKFYAPPPLQPPSASPRRRGRPPKARLMSQLSRQEVPAENSNQTSSSPLRRPKGQMSCFVKSRQITKEQSRSQMNIQAGEQRSRIINISSSPYQVVGPKTNMKGKTRHIAVDNKRAVDAERSTFHTNDINETLIDISLTEVPDPVGGYGRERNVSCNDTRNQGIDPKILQHVANALQYMAGSQNAVDGVKLKSRTLDMNKNLANTLKAINKKHGDITEDCSLESDCMKTLVLLGICKVVQDLQRKQLKDLDVSTLDSYYTAVRDAENMKVNVKWLHSRLDEIKDAVKLTDEAKVLVSEKNRRLENIDDKKKELLRCKVELERLQSEIQDIEGQLAQEVVMVEKLNKRIDAQTSKFSEFQYTYLMDGLI